MDRSGDLSDFGVFDVTGLGLTLLTQIACNSLRSEPSNAIEQLPA